MKNNKLNFITEEMFALLNTLSPDAKPKWGKMNAQQMVEHVMGFFNVSTEKLQFTLVTPEEHLPKYKDFLYSDKEFRENTKAPSTVLGEEPLPLHYPTLSIAIEKLKQSVDNFIKYFEKEASRKTLHPVFSMLSFDEWVLLHYKHVRHHLRQFSLVS